MKKLEIFEETGEDQKLATEIFKLSSKAITREQIRTKLNISPALWYQMMKYHNPIYLNALTRGEHIGVEQVEQALKSRAIGYSFTKKKYRKRLHDDGRTTIDDELIEEVIPPDVKAIIFYLSNRAPERWMNTQKLEMKHDGKIETIKNPLESLSVEDLKKLADSVSDDDD